MAIKLEMLDKPCTDCAVTHGFYMEHAIELSKKDKATQVVELSNWDCHNYFGKKACRGAYNVIQSK